MPSPRRPTVGFLFCADSGTKGDMKVVILGAAGQLGRQLGKILHGDVVALARADADLTNPTELRHTLARLRPHAVINAAGFTQVDRAESEPNAAFAVNALAVRDLAMICR